MPRAAATLLLAVVSSALLRAAGQAQQSSTAPRPPPPPALPPTPPPLQCSPDAEAAARARDAAVQRWHAAQQLEQTAHRFEADAQFVATALARNASDELSTWRNASPAQLAEEQRSWAARRAAAQAEVRGSTSHIKASPEASLTLPERRPLVRLKPALYPLRPNVSFILQYYRQPLAIQPIVSYYHSCTSGMRGVAHADAASPLAGLTSEFIVHVDNHEDAAAWAAAAAATGDFVTLIVSPNVHEIRGYNRGAAVARGDTLILLQDDDTPEGSCDWLADVVRLFAARPLVGAVALKKACIVVHGSCNWACQDDAIKYSDPSLLGGLPYQYVAVADFAPLALRATAYADVGGCDEGAVPSGESGILLDYELSLRLWAAGWHVAQLRVPCLKGGPLELRGGTSHGISLALRAKNQALNAIGWHARFDDAELLQITMEVRRKNGALAVEERHREALQTLYEEREAWYGSSIPAEERMRLKARLAALAAARNDTGA